ncbi:MAG: hypothetical protein AB8G99_04945 [Planctomycetaceae bacterium]
MARQKDSLLWKLMDASPKEWGWFVGGLAGLVVVLWAFARFIAWMRDDEDTTATEQLMLTEIGDLHRGGDLTDEEYRSIKGRLLERLENSDDFQTPGESEEDTKSDEEKPEAENPE